MGRARTAGRSSNRVTVKWLNTLQQTQIVPSAQKSSRHQPRQGGSVLPMQVLSTSARNYRAIHLAEGVQKAACTLGGLSSLWCVRLRSRGMWGIVLINRSACRMLPRVGCFAHHVCICGDDGCCGYVPPMPERAVRYRLELQSPKPLQFHRR